jgi:CheY-like chemotaxis protein
MPLAFHKNLQLLGLCLVVAAAPQWGQAQDAPAAGEPATVLNPPKSPLPIEPKTPEELFEATLLMVDLARLDFAKSYLAKFLEDQPDESLLLKLRDKYGPAIFVKLSHIKDLRPLSTRLLEMQNRAFNQHAHDPVRIEGLIKDLSGTPEQRAVALDQLVGAGVIVVPPLLKALNQTAATEQHDRLLETLVRIGRPAIAPLIGALQAPDGELRAAALQALGWIGSKEAVPYLWFSAAAPDEPASVHVAARDALSRLLKSPASTVDELTTTGVVAELKRTALEHFRHTFPWKPDPDGLVGIWSWNREAETVALSRVNPRTASDIVGLQLARQALALAPTRADIQVLYLSLALAAEVNAVGWENPMPTGPGTAYDLALSAGDEIVARVVREALAQRRLASAVAGLKVLAQIGSSQQWKSVPGQRSEVLEALNYPDRRVQFAAATAIMQLDPTAHFVGADRVVSIFSRALVSSETPRALVIDASSERGSVMTGFLGDLGYDTLRAPTGREGFQIASERLDIELILVHANVIRWGLSQTLANLRADARTAGIPIAIYGEESAKRRRFALELTEVEERGEQVIADAFREFLGKLEAARGAPVTDSEKRGIRKEPNNQKVAVFARNFMQRSAQFVTGTPEQQAASAQVIKEEWAPVQETLDSLDEQIQRLRLFNETELGGILQHYPQLALFVEPTSVKDLDLQLQPFLRSLQAPALTAAQRQSQAIAAGYWLAHIAEGQRTKLFDLAPAEEALLAGIERPELAENAIVALSAIPSRRSQQRLAQGVLNPQWPAELRDAAAIQLAYHIQRHGLLLTNESVRDLHAAWDSATDAGFRTALGGVIGSLKPNAALVGKRLRNYSPAGAPAPEPAAAPAPEAP